MFKQNSALFCYVLLVSLVKLLFLQQQQQQQQQKSDMLRQTK